MTIDCKIIMLHTTVYEAFWKSGLQYSYRVGVCGGVGVHRTPQFSSRLWHTYIIITLIDAPSIIHQGLITSQGVVLYLTNWQTDTQCLILCLSSEVLRPNIPYTKWRGLLSHLSSLVLWHSAASVTTRSQAKVLVNWLQLCKWTRVFRH